MILDDLTQIAQKLEGNRVSLKSNYSEMINHLISIKTMIMQITDSSIKAAPLEQINKVLDSCNSLIKRIDSIITSTNKSISIYQKNMNNDIEDLTYNAKKINNDFGHALDALKDIDTLQ